jgi:hypothetical protein
MDDELWSVLPELLAYHLDKTATVPESAKRALASDMSTNSRNTIIINYSKTVAHMDKDQIKLFQKTASRIRRQILNSGYQRNARSKSPHQAEQKSIAAQCNQIQMHVLTGQAPFTIIHAVID